MIRPNVCTDIRLIWTKQGNMCVYPRIRRIRLFDGTHPHIRTHEFGFKRGCVLHHEAETVHNLRHTQDLRVVSMCGKYREIYGDEGCGQVCVNVRMDPEARTSGVSKSGKGGF